jgi:hypothetical protein
MLTLINALDDCEYQLTSFADYLGQTQKIIDEFCLHDYSNIPTWISVVDGRIERKLFRRLQMAIGLWREALIRQEKEHTKEKKRMRLKVKQHRRISSIEHTQMDFLFFRKKKKRKSY